MIQIIDNWRDLPLGVYLDILEIQRTEQDELARQSAIIAALTGMNAADVVQLPLAEYKRLRAAAGFLAEEIPDDLLRIADRYTCGDLTLVRVKNYDELTVAQYVDFQSFGREPEKRPIRQEALKTSPRQRHGKRCRSQENSLSVITA